MPVAQLDRASASGAEGYRFDPCRAYHSFFPRDEAAFPVAGVFFFPGLPRMGEGAMSWQLMVGIALAGVLGTLCRWGIALLPWWGTSFP